MISRLKTTALEHCLPLLAVENDMIVSKNADLTVAYRVELPELFTMDAADYEAIHGELTQGDSGIATLYRRAQTGLAHDCPVPAGNKRRCRISCAAL